MKRVILIFASFALVIFLLSSCAVSSKISTEVSEKAKSQKPPEGKSLVYIYRISSLGFAVGLNVSLNDKMLGSFYPKRFYLCTLDPGKYLITGHGENEDDLILTTEPDKTYYVEARPKMGFASARIGLELRDEINGNNDVRKCKMIGSTDAVLPVASQEVKQEQIQQNISQPYNQTSDLMENDNFNPTGQGHYVLSGGSALQFISSKEKSVYDGKTEYEDNSSSFSIVPSFAYFATDNLAIGLTSTITSTTYKSENGSKDVSNSILVMPTVLYYFPMEGNVRPIVQIGAGLSSNSYKYIPKTGNDEKYSASGLALNFGGGIAYFMKENISLNFGLSYTMVNLTDGDDNKSEMKQGSFGSNIGLSIYF